MGPFLSFPTSSNNFKPFRELTPHTLYWNDLLAQGKLKFGRQEDTKEAKWTLDISDLLDTPPVQSTVFEVGKEYRGKQFDGYVR